MIATRDDWVQRFGEVEAALLTDPDNTGTPDPTVLERELLVASETVKSFVARRYAWPLPTVPVALINAACDMARYQLYKDRPPDQVKQRNHDALSYLRDLSHGDAVLVFSPPLEIVGSRKPVVGLSGPAVFTGELFASMPGVVTIYDRMHRLR